ncbi:elongation factor P [Candidatus Wirthbacteria bacterium CG2_30_54_11]|uniref:Elongation factor P n=1 Tax=Candidatus Wirthbacteria bacterium CG2_30_54_11 TaxID=1817892 RepID=A0A1J5J0T0_9BACT|nr:MAG: elongation factor P [Candidatus Wirthbacteria bacterium CG2_30_54_11]
MEINDIHKGSVIMIDGNAYKVIDNQAVKPGKGTAFSRTKLRALMSDKTIELTFKAGEKIQEAEVNYFDCQYLYNDPESFIFMLKDNFEQYSLPKDAIGERAKFFKENMDCKMVFLNGNPVDVNIPPKMDFKVTEADPGAKGNTATGATKQVTIETGAQITVPLFVKQGDTIRVNTETGEYDVRV